MEPVQFVLPVLATSALGVALFVPLRDDRLGRRATLNAGNGPLRADFGALAQAPKDEPQDASLEATRAAGIALPTEVREQAPHPAPSRELARLDAAHELSNAASDALLEVRTAAETPIEVRKAASDALYDVQGTSDAFDEAQMETSVLSENLTVSPPRGQHAGAFLADIWQHFRRGPRIPTSPAPGTNAAIVVERSFAGELASLLGASSAPQRSNESKIPADAHALEPATHNAVFHKPTDATVAGATLADAAFAGAAFADAAFAGAAVNDAAFSENGGANAQPIVVQPVRAPLDRVVPLTRLPLRPQSRELTWFVALDGSPPQSVTERYELLQQFTETPDPPELALLTQAYRQEDGQGRVLALRALAAHHAVEARGTFIDALHTGTDDERVIAVDVLAATNAREALPVAFGDRVDAIAARAALAFVGTNVRADYEHALQPHLDAARIETVLALLAGFVE